MTDTWVQGDTEPPITAALERAGAPIPLAGCSVRFQMRKADGKYYMVNATAAVDDENGGLVRYSWGATDLNIPGDYLVQWEITYQSGRVETTDPPNTITVRKQ